MDDHPAVSPSDVPVFDLSFRPKTYFWPLGLETHLFTRLKGAERRAALQRFITAGRLNEIPALLAEPSLRALERQAIGRLHPDFLGGEFLPDFAQNEVEIARITIASTTQDVTSVFACRGKRRIYYRVVDEYDGETLHGKASRSSMRPLTLGELAAFFSGAWSIRRVLEMNFRDSGYDVQKMLRFVRGIDSQFYPQLGKLYKLQIRRWAAAQRVTVTRGRDTTPMRS